MAEDNRIVKSIEDVNESQPESSETDSTSKTSSLETRQSDDDNKDNHHEESSWSSKGSEGANNTGTGSDSCIGSHIEKESGLDRSDSGKQTQEGLVDESTKMVKEPAKNTEETSKDTDAAANKTEVTAKEKQETAEGTKETAKETQEIAKDMKEIEESAKDDSARASLAEGEDDKNEEVRIPREFEPLWGVMSQIPKKAQRGLLMQCDLILTCVNADKTYIVLGTNIGLVFLYDRNKQTMERLKTDSPSDVVTCVQLHHGIDYQLAVGMASGAVCMFLLPSMMTGLNKQLQKFSVKDMHRTYLTCVEWSTNGMKLFSGDKTGTVVTTEVDFYQGQCKSSVLLIEAHAEIVQLHYLHKVILISTRQRSLVCRLDDRDRIVQIGQQERKILGGFGACFIPGLCKADDAELFASRPGCRIWRASIDGSVKHTSLFKDFLGRSSSEIPLFKPEKSLTSQEAQFGKVHVYRDNQLLTWTPLGLFLLDPVDNVVIAHSDRLGYIADVSICNDEIFVLRRNCDNVLVRIAERAEAPLVKSILSSVQLGNSPYKSTGLPLMSHDTHVTREDVLSMQQESKHMSPGTFFKKNILGKFNKFLDLKSDTRRETGLQPEVSVKQLIDEEYRCEDGHNCEPPVTSPDLPPVIKINSPELTALQVYAGIAGSPLSPEGGQSVGQVNTYCAKTGETIQHGPDTVHDANTAAHLSLIAERVHINPTKKTVQGDIVFQDKPKKHKRKHKHKHEKPKAKEEDEVSQNSDTSQSETATSISVEEHVSQTVDTSRVAEDILQTTKELLKHSSTENETETEDPVKDVKEPKQSKDPKQSPGASSSGSSNFDPSSIPYIYSVDKTSLPENSNNFRTHKLNKLARDLSSGYGTDVKDTISDSSGKDASLPSDLTSPLSPGARKSKDSFYATSDTSTEDFYKKYRSQSSLDSSVTSPAIPSLPSPEPQPQQTASPEDEPASSPKTEHDKIAVGTLLKLANSWSEIMTPTNVYSLVLSETHIWFTDKSENIYYSGLSGPKGVVWRKATGQARQIAVSSNGGIVWRLHKTTVYAGTKLTARRPEGMKWVEAVKDVAYIAVDDTCAWYIKTSGELMMQKGLSMERPCFKSISVLGSPRVKHIACRGGMVWGLTEKHKLVYRAGVTESCPEGKEWKKWSSTDDILFSHVTIGDQGTGWGVDVVGRIWFCCGADGAPPCGQDRWWQVPMSEYFVQDATALDALRSLASKFDPQKLSYLLSTSRGGLITAGPQGVWVCLEYKNVLHVCRGNFQGYSWQDAPPSGMASSTMWNTVSANIADLEWGLVWAQQPNGELYTFPSETRQAQRISPSPEFTCLHAGPIAVWGIDKHGKVWVRAGMGPFCPQGASWAELDLSQLGDSQLVHVSCNSQYVWTVDSTGMVYQRIGSKAPTDQQLSPAWLPIDSFSEIIFTQVVTGPLEWMVWAIDDRRLGYVRQGITDRMPIGREWVHVPGTQIIELTVTKSGVWALNPHGEVLYRYGITRDNVCGNYWKKVPGVFAHLSASPTDDLWAISREGNLLQCQTKYLMRRQTSSDNIVRRSLSVGSEEGDAEWELV